MQTMKSLDLPYIPIVETRGFTATSGNKKWEMLKYEDKEGEISYGRNE